MNVLTKLIGQSVVAYLEDKQIKGRVIGFHIEDFYFYEKNESIYITVNLVPLSNDETLIPLDSYDDFEDYCDIPLDCIRLN